MNRHGLHREYSTFTFHYSNRTCSVALQAEVVAGWRPIHSKCVNPNRSRKRPPNLGHQPGFEDTPEFKLFLEKHRRRSR